MKRFLLSSLILLAMGKTAFATWLNSGTIQVPPMSADLIQVDDANFVNKGTLSIDLTLLQQITGATLYYTTSDTLNYTNSGVLIGLPGFDFENFPANVGVPKMAANFVNTNAGAGSGIFITNSIGFNPFTANSGGLFTPVNFELVTGIPELKVRATNIVDSGLVAIDNIGLVDMVGKDLNMNRAQFQMFADNVFLIGIEGGFFGAGNFGINLLDSGVGFFGQTNHSTWQPGLQLTPTTATSDLFSTALFPFPFAEMILNTPTVYTENLSPATNADNTIVWRMIYLQDFSPPNVTKNVYFGASDTGPGTFHIEWAGSYRDPQTDQTLTNYFELSDEPADRRNTNTFFFPPPSDFSFAESLAPGFFVNPPAVPSYANPIQPPDAVVTNDYSYVSIQPTAILVDTNSVVGGNVTNLPGRIQLTASDSLNLANTRISGGGYLSFSSPNFLGNSNSAIASLYADLKLGVTNGSLSISNLLMPSIPNWIPVPNAPNAVFGSLMNGIQAWSASYFFTDTNGVTNDVRILLVNSAIQPTAPTLQKDVVLHAPNDLTISDVLNVYHNFFADSQVLTITTNANSAYSLEGELNLFSPDIFWSASLPNLQYLTNYGGISAVNEINFAGNMLSSLSDPNAATPYQAIVNHGKIVADGIFARANYFENSGDIEAAPHNGLDFGINGDVIATNGTFTALEGPISLSGSTLFLSNGVINAGQTLTLGASCFLSDGYVFGNQFGHITNALLPNVVTNGNSWTADGNIQVPIKPATGDLLGTTITAIAANNKDSTFVWPGEDRGASQNGYAENLAVGRLILNADATSQFTFAPANGNNAIYVDRLELQGNATVTDNNGNPKYISIQPGMKVYFAEATENGVSIAEKLNGKYGGGSLANGGQFYWVSNYAGVYSSTNIPYPDGNTYIFNHALAISPDIDSDGDGTVNRDDSTPISIGTTYDITNAGPVACGGGGGGGGNNGGNNNNGGGGSTSGVVKPGTLALPQEATGSSGVSFLIAQGSYSGLFYDTNGVTPASSGFFTAKVTARGGLSAKLQLGTHTYSFSKPPFDTSGHFSGTVTGKGLAPLTVDLQIVNNDEIVGTVSGAGWTAQLLAERTPFTSKNKAPWAGTDTLLLSSDTNSVTAAGDSFGTVKITASGAVQWTGMLPDGAKVSQKSALSKNGLWPLYAAPYNGAGSFIGWMYCTNGSDITGSGVWIVPAGVSKLYPQGLTNRLDAAGSGVSGVAPFSATAVLSGPSLSSSITNVVTIVGKSGQSHDGTVKLSVNAKTGLFTGSVTQPGSPAFSVQGAFLENSGIGGGFFLNAGQNEGGKIYLAPAN